MIILPTIIKPRGRIVLSVAGSYAFSPPTDKVYVTIYPACGGGGGGGTPTGRFPEYGSAGGGGGGGYGTTYEKHLIKLLPTKTIEIIVGAGGAGGSRGLPSSWFDGGRNGSGGGAGGYSYFSGIAYTNRGNGGAGGGWKGSGGAGATIGGSSGGKGYSGSGGTNPNNSESKGGQGGGPSSNGIKGKDAIIVIEW